MRYKLIGCKVFMRELYQLCAQSENIVEIVWMKEALHLTPSKLRAALQRTIDRIEEEAQDPDNNPCDAILLGYGLCSMGIVGLHTRHIPLVIPRAHDCITLLLGGRERYQQLFEAHSGGVYWYSPGWIEQFKTPGRGSNEEAKFAEYVEKYGEENAEYLMEVERGWIEHYDCAAFIKWPGFDTQKYELATQQAAEKSHLPYQVAEGADTLLRRMIEGDWSEDFLVLQPGQVVEASNDEGVIRVRG